ncbi:Atxe2 family lasso peptide isopeptidase [Novosphingobium sp. G106]|uniref:Atxe2 family lasso peptide isopeptidase n=1 Tax=Novosphingobium sp. G106 TaxID=2849500 RepID=UPI001C2DA44B|nr:Atxe2 family lasso peptide isopeptidase [Novosphingobium sp. G106]MBV1686409.1 Atxe2 family lasso peptide isopeptidase [Novosphingobium sp. G106]
MVRLTGAALVALVLAPSPALAGPTSRQLVELVDISGLAASPDGKWLAFREEHPSIEGNAIATTWLVARLSGGQPARVASGGEAIFDGETFALESPQWSRDSRWIYYRALVGGQVQVWRATAAGSQAEQVTHDEADVIAFQVRDDGSLIYRVGATRQAIIDAEQREYDQGIRFDKSIEPGQAIFRGALINGRRATQRLSGEWFDRRGLLGGTPHRYRIAIAGSPAARDARPAELAAWSQDAPSKYGEAAQRPNRDGSLVAELTMHGPKSGLRVRSVADRIEYPCPIALCGKGRVSGVTWLRDEKTLLVTITDIYKAQSLFRWNIRNGASDLLASDDGLMGSSRSIASNCAVARTVVACVIAGPARPPRIDAINLGTRARRIVAEPNADLPSIAAKPIEWRTADGQMFTGQFVAPTGKTGSPPPLFITYYQCRGFLRGGTGDEWPLAALVDAGIAVLCINAVTQEDLGRKADAVADYRLALEGISSIAQDLSRRGAIDPARIGMGGLSFGGEVTAWVAMHSNLLRAVSLSSVLFEPTYYWFNGAPGRDAHAKLREWWGLGAPNETPARWKEVSPAMNTDRIRAAVLMQLPEQEYRYNLELIAKLSEAKTPTEVYVFPDEPHAKVQPRHKLAVYERNLAWFERWLLPYATPETGASYYSSP